jgi:hypothetical protein
MGLFDAYDPATYQPAQGGLLDRLLASVAATPTPGAGFPGAQPSPLDNAQWPAGPVGAPTNANAAMPPAAAPAPQPQNDPIAVGNYMMPRIGSGFDLPPGQLDPSTGEHVAPAPAAAPMQQPAAQPENAWSSFFNKAADGLESVAHGGTLLGALRGQPTDARSVQQRQLKAQYDAYVGAGIPPQIAQLAVLNPEAGKVLIEKALGPNTVQSLGSGYVWDPRQGKAVKAYEPDDKWKVVQTGEDGLGRKTFLQQNPADGSFKPIPAAPGATDTGGGLGDMNLTGDAYLASMPKSEANIVKMMAEGTQAPPSSYALGKQLWVNRIAAAKNYDPTFDGANWSGRVAGVKDFSAGKSSEMVRSANQTLAHVNSLLDSADALHNGDYPSVNWVGNKFNEATGAGEPGAFRTNAHAVAEEMSKVFKGANMSDAEIHAWENNLSENMSPAQQRAQIGKLSELLHGSLDALEEKRLNSIGPMAAAKQGPLIKPEGQKVLQRIDAWLKAGNASGAASGGTAPTGVKWSVVQ